MLNRLRNLIYHSFYSKQKKFEKAKLDWKQEMESMRKESDSQRAELNSVKGELLKAQKDLLLLEQQKENSDALVNRLSAEVASYQTKIEKANSIASAEENRCLNLSSANEDLKSRLESSLEELESVKTLLSDLKNSSKERDIELSRVEEERDRLALSLVESQKETENQRILVEGLIKEVTQLNSEHQQRFIELESQVRDLEQRLETSQCEHEESNRFTKENSDLVSLLEEREEERKSQTIQQQSFREEVEKQQREYQQIVDTPKGQIIDIEQREDTPLQEQEIDDSLISTSTSEAESQNKESIELEVEWQEQSLQEDVCSVVDDSSENQTQTDILDPLSLGENREEELSLSMINPVDEANSPTEKCRVEEPQPEDNSNVVAEEEDQEDVYIADSQKIYGEDLPLEKARCKPDIQVYRQDEKTDVEISLNTEEVLSRLSLQQEEQVVSIVQNTEEYKSRWSIKEVIEVETGQSVSVEEIFSRSEAELAFIRKHQQEAVMGLKDPLYICPECGETLNLAGHQKVVGKIIHFTHTRRSEKEIASRERECPLRSIIDDNGREERKESDINREGAQHRIVKEKIYELLTHTPGVESLYLEQNITSEIEGLEWKRPDIQFRYKGHSIVCELLLSSIYLSVITERELFYRLKEHFVLWVFSFEKEKQQKEFEALFVKDIYYANKRNAFIFTKEAYEASEATGILHLSCIWFEPCLENGVYNPTKAIRKSKLVTLEDLSFEEFSCKPYYVDAEAMFAPYNKPFYNAYTNSYQLSLSDLERITMAFLNRKIARNKLRRERIEKVKEEQDEAKALLVASDVQITLFQNKSGKWGWKVHGVIIEPATYTSAELYEEQELILLYKGRRYHFIDYKGNEIGPIFHELFSILNGKCFIRINKEYYLLNLSSGDVELTPYQEINSIKDLDFLVEVHTDRIEYDSNYYYSYRVKVRESKYCLADGASIYDEVKLLNEKLGGVRRENKWGCINAQGEEVIPIEYDAIESFEGDLVRARKKDKWGCINTQGDEVIPFAYDAIESFEGDFARAKRNYSWGKINLQGASVSEDVEEVSQGIFKAKQFEKWGLQDMHGNVILPFEYRWISLFEGDLARAQKGSSWGCINTQGEEVVPFEYYAIESFEGNLARAQKGSSWGCINAQGEEVIPFAYDAIEPFEGDLARAKREGYRGKWGCINTQDEKIIPFVYDAIEPFEGDFARVKKNDKWGCINTQGKVIIPFKYEGLELFKGDFAIAKKNDKWGCIDTQDDEVIPFAYDAIESFDGDLARVKRYGRWGKINLQGDPVSEDVEEVSQGIFKAKQFEKWGLQDMHGNVILPFEYRWISLFEGNLARAQKGSSWGCINAQGEEVIPFAYDAIEPFEGDLARAKREGYRGKWGCINTQDEKIIPFVYDAIEPFEGDFARVKKNDKWGCINTQGKVIIPFKYEGLELFKGDFAIAKKNDKWGCIDTQDDEVIPFAYDAIESFDGDLARVKRYGRWGKINLQGDPVSEDVEEVSQGIFKAKQFEKWGFQDIHGNVILPFAYDVIESFEGDLARAKKGGCGGYWGCVNIQGDEVIPFAYDAIVPFEGDLAIAKRGDYWGCVNIQDDEVIPFAYDAIEPFEGDLARAMKKDKWGLINTQGDEVIPFAYDAIEPFEGDLARARKYGRWGFINTQGDEVISFAYDAIEPFEGDFARAKKNGKWGKINLQGDPVSEDVEEVSQGIFKAKQFEKWGFQDIHGNVILPFVYDVINSFEDDLAGVQKEGKWGKINLQGDSVSEEVEEVSQGIFKAKQFEKWGFQDIHGNVILPFAYDVIESFEGDLARAKKGGCGGYWGCINIQGEEVIPFAYGAIKSFEGNVARARKYGRWGFINTQGDEVIPFEYDEIKSFEGDLARAYKGGDWWGYWGCINTQGDEVIPFTYDAIEPFEGDLARTKKNGKWGCINTQGDEVIPFEYDAIGSFDSNIAFARKNYKWGVIDHKGEIRVPFFCNRLMRAREGYITYSGALYSPKNRRPKGEFQYIPDPSVRKEVSSAFVLNTQPYGVFVSIKGTPAALIHKKKLKAVGIDLHRLKRGDQLQVVLTGVDEQRGFLEVEIVSQGIMKCRKR